MSEDVFAPGLARLHALPGPAAAHAVDPDGRVLVSLAADEPFPAASVIKVALVMALYADAAEGRLSLAERVPVGKRAAGSGVLGSLEHLADVETLSLRDLAALAINVSDNTAANRLIDRIGTDRVNQRLDEWSCPRTRLQRRMFDFEARARGLENVTTARESCALLLRLQRGELADRATSEAVITLLRDCQDGTHLARYLPVDVRVAHKSGWMEGVRADIGVVPGPRPVAVAGLTRDQKPAEPARAALGILGWCAYRAAGADVPPLPFEVVAPA